MDKFPSPCHLERLNEVVLGGGLVVDDIVSHRAVEEEGFLAHEANRLAQRMKGVIADGPAVDQHFTAVGGIIPHEQFQNRGFPSTGVTHHAEEFTLLDLEGNAVEHFDGGVRIGEVDVFEFHGFDDTFQGHSVFAVHDGGLKVNRSEDAASCCFTTLKLVDQNTKDEHRHRHSGADQEEGDQLSSRDFSLTRKISAGRREQSKGHTGNGVNHGNESIAVSTGSHGLVSVRTRFCRHTVCFPLLGIVCLDHGDTGNEVLQDGMNITGRFSLFAVFALHPC